MELPSNILEQIAFNTRSRIDEHILIVMDKSTRQEHLSQPLQTNNNQFKLAVTFSTCFNGIFQVPDKKKFISQKQLLMMMVSFKKQYPKELTTLKV